MGVMRMAGPKPKGTNPGAGSEGAYNQPPIYTPSVPGEKKKIRSSWT